MKLRVEKLKAADMRTLLERGVNNFIGKNLTQAQLESLEAGDHTYSIFIDDKVVLCGGVTEYWRNRGEAWAILDPDCRADFVPIHSAVKRFFDLCPVRRIEAAVDVDFERGNRWVRALGFELEATLRKFLPDGQDVFFYSRVREDEWPLQQLQ